MKLTKLICLILVARGLNAQLPATEIFLFTLSVMNDTVEVVDAQFHSGFNMVGYNNQPSATDYGYLMTAAGSKNDQTDILRMHVSDHRKERFTSTLSFSEYSPEFVKASDEIFCVRVDSAGDQNLWAYPTDKSHGGRNVISGEKKVGYYELMGSDSIALFITGPPHKLVIYSGDSLPYYQVDQGIGRCLQYHKDQLYYVDKRSSEVWYLKRFIPRLKLSAQVAVMPIEVEDFYITESGEILIGQGPRIMRLTRDKTWKTYVDLEPYGIRQITRLTMAGNNLLCVNKMGK